jgi:hypothetical protein
MTKYDKIPFLACLHSMAVADIFRHSTATYCTRSFSQRCTTYEYSTSVFSVFPPSVCNHTVRLRSTANCSTRRTPSWRLSCCPFFRRACTNGQINCPPFLSPTVASGCLTPKKDYFFEISPIQLNDFFLLPVLSPLGFSYWIPVVAFVRYMDWEFLRPRM